ncbi:hypothetical protein C8Q70DRAFT_1050187 [Cubamyces menziesii]|nr:hypothetical protein C8Q70DRAFT_1050187 [Cubamyces menziesii]
MAAAGGVEKGKDERQSRQPSSDSVRTRAPAHTARSETVLSSSSPSPPRCLLRLPSQSPSPHAPFHPVPPSEPSSTSPRLPSLPRPPAARCPLSSPNRRRRRPPGGSGGARSDQQQSPSPLSPSGQRGSAAWSIIQSLHGAVFLFPDDAAGIVRRPPAQRSPRPSRLSARFLPTPSIILGLVLDTSNVLFRAGPATAHRTASSDSSAAASAAHLSLLPRIHAALAASQSPTRMFP